MNEAKRQPWPGLIATWAKSDAVGAALLTAIVGTLIYFFGFHPLFTNGKLSTWTWAWQAWNPETNYEHAKLIPLIVAFLVWNSRDKLRAATIGSSRWGWLFIGIGLFLFVAGARTLQARLSLTAIPFTLFGIVLYVWGREVARVLLFPIAFLLFTVPLNFVAQATVKLQFVETGFASAICNAIGISVYRVGTAVHAANEAFQFEVDEGCSGIRSLMAISMLAAIYGHLTQDRLWKKLAIFAAALIFAIIGNAGRLVSIFAVAKWFGQNLAGGPYHTISGYLSFPFALGAMVLFAKLINVRPAPIKQAAAVKETVKYDY